jgi:hypothetical protein
MKTNKWIIDFIVFEDGNIGHKAAVATGALLASAMTSALLVSQAEAASCHCNHHDDFMSCIYFQCHYDAHDNRSGVCPLPC